MSFCWTVAAPPSERKKDNRLYCYKIPSISRLASGCCRVFYWSVGMCFMLTRYNDLEEIHRGNQVAGLYTGSKLLGLSINVAMDSYSSTTWVDMLI
jgi:uncharacterized membrane protein YjfL (UPF0719 family)